MKIYKTKSALKEYLASLKKADKSIGFVPTMGALHQGHLSLIKKAKQHNAITVVSIFVNPTQFDNQEDLVNYPKTIDQDIALLESVNCEVLFLPSVAEIYDNNITADTFNFDGLEHQMEGEFRDGHFDGVGTIVKSLFEIVAPNTAYFGKKDFQQLQIIKKLVKKHQIPVKVKGCAIFREQDGLAMSSRNSRLSEEYRDVAPFIYRTLKKAKKKFGIKSADKVTKWVVKKFKKHPLLRLEYFTIASEETLKTVKIKAENEKYRAFIAVFAGDIRLIDNIRLK
ncbi:pantoate--beta-alanine ligase [Tenacibaculum finnmarkense]|uniref:Pantothenate synthetase n=1 Tax=Tenacibaculum finnmarkense genomovar finnmarkense TaxID=1458503 RepID=A0AAP1WFA6_9FLAO|nr:pantoate--beta-alanine ligase [Tenacibaculum finnmarkense]MBE7652152.1 pantoate--beta-alanine ligase [Tenacibaculum finnmarkense genomovar finnmarkense]MBE7694133.1 pantoate--beta-alanine ligase [Tenacibaculum finnmarkense genomovar finnmarkense]MCD8426369.1 pantoate--beta-alanine ligase [Tenacibaculum finnmarkense genomovar finnmarkense]MCG8730161.1 pantoate--beta-alanine ligase [Tenacibaculum finnmarkense]MCG8751148.1 pantoate--beta-alanine ligase [Tenacibaculum finnmarkense]